MNFAAIYARCRLSFVAFFFARSLLRLAIHILPGDHPSKTYVAGRFASGNERIGNALGKAATARYIADRRAA